MAVAAAIAAIVSASGVVEFVKNYAVSFAEEEFKGLRDLKQKVNGLSKTLESIQADLKVAEERQDGSEDIRKWLQELKNVAYDLEDVLDDYALVGPAEDEENMGAIMQWTRLAIHSLWLPCDVLLSCFGIATPVTPLRNISHRLQSIKKDLERINQEKGGLGLLKGLSGEASPSGSMSSEASTSSKKVWPMVGRLETKNEIKTALLKSSSKVTVVSIAGLGGIGKTTLAKEIFSDEDMKEHFPIRKWVFVGVKFDAVRLIDQIIREKPDDDLPKDLDALRTKLEEKIENNGFLIVLDDAWCTDGEEWEKLCSPLTQGKKRGALVVTARNVTVARAIPCDSTNSEHLLGEMPEEECLEILKRSALKSQKQENYQHREGQCKQIVKKLKGVPLAADIMGRFLGKHLDDDTWRDVVTDDGWSQKDEEELVHRVTGLSYRHLPSHLKPCFAYCSIFPKGFIFDKETLVQMWIAQGYIQPRRDRLMEHTGSFFFNELCEMSFFQIQDDEDYVMHDLIHDYAQMIFVEGRQDIGGGDCEVPEQGLRTIVEAVPEQTRHLSLDCRKLDPILLKQFRKFKKLRTLIIPNIYDHPVDLLGDVLGEFKYMRVLILCCYEISELPESIGHLKLLRYLDISETGVSALPELVCNLLNLQVLKVNMFCELPQVTSKLVNLRCLEGRKDDLQQIGRLTSLQELSRFELQKEKGGRIKQLGSLNNLHKALSITGLENVQSKEEALLANLKDKVYLKELQLEWEYSESENEGELWENYLKDRQRMMELWERRDNREELRFTIPQMVRMRMMVWQRAEGIPVSDSQVLEGLCPPPHLERLVIIKNLEAQPPSWMKEQHQFLWSNLSDVSLHGCSYWTCLPSLGQLPALRKLDLIGANAVKMVGPEFFSRTENAFPRLNHLHFSSMDQWEGWDYRPVGRVFPSLQVLHLDYCPKLTSLSPMLRHMTSLMELKICRCTQLASLEEDGGEWMFASLRRLTIESCPKLTSLSPVLRHMTTLTELKICRCAQLASLEVRDLSALEFLLLEECDQLSSLVVPPLLPSLNSLEIKCCPLLKELATLPSSSQQRQEGNDDHGEGPSSSSFPRFQSFSTDNRCLLMRILPQKLGSLESLKITDPHHDLIRFTEAEEEGWKHLTSLSAVTIRDCPELESLPSSMHILPSLHKLNLKYCSKINRLPDGGLPASLRELTIRGCLELESLPSSMHILPSLHKLYLRDCPKINRLPDGGLPASLQKLTIHDCPELESLPSSMHILLSLHELDLRHCHKINRLPDGGLPASLRVLMIIDCPELEESCQEGGPDHHKIPSNADIFL